jgi:hypothetical protein
MQIPKELADNNQCVLCRRTWEEVHGSDWKNCGVHYYLIDTTRNLAICWRCYEEGDDLVRNGCGGSMSFYDKLPPDISDACRFCGTFNSQARTNERPIFVA